jgi:hypothetical protein
MPELGYSNRGTGAWIYTGAWIQKLGYRSLYAGDWYRNVDTGWWDSTIPYISWRTGAWRKTIIQYTIYRLS